jgi:hypothetical protein
MGVGDPGPGRSAVFGDIDGDGDPDLYVVNYGSANRLYRNNGRERQLVAAQSGETSKTFTQITEQAGVGDPGRGNGAAFGDLDNDGDLDLVVANEGRPVVYQNRGDGRFTDVTETAGLTREGLWVSPVLADVDNDGDLDCYLSSHDGQDALYTNDGQGRFTDRSVELGQTVRRRGFGAAAGDYDGDGMVDLFVAADGADIVYRNTGRGTHYLTIEVVGTTANRDGVGARVRVVSGDLTQIREVTGGSGYCSQGSRLLTFGLGERTTIDSVEVVWPGGHRQVVMGEAVDRVLRVEQPRVTAVEVVDLPHELPDRVTLWQNTPNPFNGITTIRFGLPVAGRVTLTLYDLNGRLIRTLVDRSQEAGFSAIRWDGQDARGRPVASGIYLYRLTTGNVTQTRKIVVLR